MNNKDNKYNQYRKKRTSAYFLACNGSKKLIKKLVIKNSVEGLSLFWAFYADTAVDKKGIRFNNHKYE